MTLKDLDLDIMLDDRDFGCRCVRCSTTRIEGGIPLWDENPAKRIVLLNQHKAWLVERERKHADGILKSLGGTLYDIEVGLDPEQLVPPYLAPEGVTVIYGRGGVGKGMVSIWLIQKLIEAGLKVMVIDYEGHPKEWARRARKLGWSDETLRAVLYRAPFSSTWEAERGALHEVADVITADVAQNDVDYIVVDSFTTATSTGDSLGGKDSAQEFFTSIERIGVPALVIAHVAGGQGRFPEKPFGSVFVHNLARETWAVERTHEGEVEVEFDHETWKVQPKVQSLELRNLKKNDGELARPQFLAFSWFFDGHVEVNEEQPKPASVADAIASVMSRSGKSLTVTAIATLLKADSGENVSPENVRTILKRNGRQFEVVPGTVPAEWKVRSGRSDD